MSLTLATRETDAGKGGRVSEPHREDRPVALVTGATGGIGYELAKLLAAGGHDLILVARREEDLRRVAAEFVARHGVEVSTIPADLSGAGAAERVVAAAGGPERRVDVLVNNAGFAVYGPFVETDAAAELAMIGVNVVTLTHLTKLLVPGMRRRGRGRVLNVASTAAFLPGPLMTVYYATKAYVLSFSEGLAEELRGTGVTVTALCPGPTETGFQRRAAMEDSKLISGRRIAAAETVARAGYVGLMRGQRVVVPGLVNRVTVQVPRLVPRAVMARLVRRAQERVEAAE